MRVLSGRWLAVTALAAGLSVGIWQVPRWASFGARQRLASQYQARLAKVSASQATELLHVLASDDPAWLEVLVEGLVDQRPAIQVVAKEELLRLVRQWSAVRSLENSAAAEKLAACLAARARSVTAKQLNFAQELAQELLLVPMDGRLVDVAAFTANCEAVLLAQPTRVEEMRMASQDKTFEADESSPPGERFAEPTHLSNQNRRPLTER